MMKSFDHLALGRFSLGKIAKILALSLLLAVFWGCDRPQGSAPPVVSPTPTQPESNSSDSVRQGPESAPNDSPGVEKGKTPEGEVAILAGGCFWGMEDILREVPGVLHTEVGYSGGATESPTYDVVKKGHSGHAESVKIVFDPEKISYGELLEKWFFRMHDPTTEDRQGNDVGSQYRSAIFFTSDEQKKVALAVIRRVDQSGQWKSPIVTEVKAAGEFTPAEDYHQDYLEKNPGGYTCHYMRDSVY
jgi:methionine-S-sulfoxide reductase